MSANTMPSQADVVIGLLTEQRGEWVEMPFLAAAMCGFAVHSRIAELRKRGHRIEHKNRRQGRAVHSFYRLTDGKDVAS